MPKTAKQIKSFFGITGYYRKFVKVYAKVAHGLTKYLKNNTEINKRAPQYISSFQKLKSLLMDPPILKFLTIAIGAVLFQNGHPIS